MSEVTGELGFLFRTRPEGKTSDPAALLGRARAGDAAARDELVRAYVPFVLRVASRTAHRYLRLGEDDEAAVGLAGFNEAIDGFDPGRGAPFLAFAATVIRRRVIDYYRQEKRQALPLAGPAEGDDERDIVSDAEVRSAIEQFERSSDAFERRDEIARYQAALARFGITWRQLVACSPRHEDARRRARRVARAVASRPDLRDALFSRRELPLKALEAATGVARKTLERQRRYIIAVAVILTGDFPYLASYVGGGLERPLGEEG